MADKKPEYDFSSTDESEVEKPKVAKKVTSAKVVVPPVVNTPAEPVAEAGPNADELEELADHVEQVASKTIWAEEGSDELMEARVSRKLALIRSMNGSVSCE